MCACIGRRLEIGRMQRRRRAPSEGGDVDGVDDEFFATSSIEVALRAVDCSRVWQMELRRRGVGRGSRMRSRSERKGQV